jgi:hypothetical protein
MPSARGSRAPGPLPAHVYKRRRLVVLTVAVLLVLGFGRVLSWSSDGSGGDEDTATQAAADTSPSAAESSTKAGKNKKECKGKDRFRDGDKAKGKRKACQGSTGTPTPPPTPTPTPPAEPSGPCPEGDLWVTPSVPDPVAGRDVTVLLNLQTGTTEACTWRVSSETVTVKIYAGVDDVWSSRECPDAVPTQDVVVRREAATPVTMVWSSGKRSDEDCTGRTAWAMPGLYGIAAAVFEGEPTDVAFELRAPVAEVVTQTAEPTQQPDQGDQSTPPG